VQPYNILTMSDKRATQSTNTPDVHLQQQKCQPARDAARSDIPAHHSLTRESNLPNS